MRFAVLETSDADARWLQLVLTDLRADVLVERFATELEALARLPELLASFDAILLDERPVVLTLRETLEEIARIPSVAGVPVVVMLGSAASRVHVSTGRVFRCIQKPINHARLPTYAYLYAPIHRQRPCRSGYAQSVPCSTWKCVVSMVSVSPQAAIVNTPKASGMKRLHRILPGSHGNKSGCINYDFVRVVRHAFAKKSVSIVERDPNRNGASLVRCLRRLLGMRAANDPRTR